MTDTHNELLEQWMNCKKQEQALTRQRREIEDQLIDVFEPATEGSKTFKTDDLTIKITSRINRRIDGDQLQELAAEHGLSDQLSLLFRWKPEINMAVWKAADSSITAPLLDAITSTGGRPSFNITRTEDK